MKTTTRRDFLKTSLSAGLALGLRALAGGAETAVSRSPSDAVRIGIIGLGGIGTVGGVGGRGRQLISRLRQIPGAKITALCDVDSAILENGAQLFKEKGESVATYRDLRQLLDDPSVDAVAVATPNHWHALATIWACQAGKDVYVEKPFSYNIWEGKQMVAAARKHQRMVQVGTQNRSSSVLREAFEYLHRGELGAVQMAHALVYRPREGIGSVSGPTPVPATVDYDLWCGPSPKAPLLRKQLHYEWHWFWATGNGEMGNNGIHVIDICRWALQQNQPPPRAMSVGGRFGPKDAAETPNTQIAFLDYQPAPIICEVRNVRVPTAKRGIGKFRQADAGVVIQCAGGYLSGDSSGVKVFDKSNQVIKEFKQGANSPDPEAPHWAAFLKAVRSRKPGDLAAESVEGHRSTTCCHIANISQRLGKESSPDVIRERLGSNAEFADTFERCREYLHDNNIQLGVTQAGLGPWLAFDGQREQFVGEFAPEANALCRREPRQPFVVPELA